jgi:uncharacterized membrane protein YphA (DoxX/SURF4 family)
MTHALTWRHWLILAARWVLGLVFIAASLPKLNTPADFALAVYRYQILPSEFINLTAILLPVTELVAGLALILWPRMRQGANLLLLLMLVVFTIAIASTMYRGIDVACGCFSVNPKSGHINWLNMARNLGLIALCFIAPRRTGRGA